MHLLDSLKHIHHSQYIFDDLSQVYNFYMKLLLLTIFYIFFHTFHTKHILIRLVQVLPFQLFQNRAFSLFDSRLDNQLELL